MAEIMLYLGFFFYGIVIVGIVILIVLSNKILNILKIIQKKIEEKTSL